MSARTRKVFMGIFLLLLGILTACGKEEEVLEYGVDGYVYLSKQLYTLEGVEELNVFGDYLYLTRDEGNRRTVERLPISSMVSNENSLNFSQKKEVLAISFAPFVLPEGAQETLEEYDFTEIVEGKGASGYMPEEEERVYCVTSLTGMAADGEQNLYYALGLTTGTLKDMEVEGNLLCRRTAEGELSYWKYLPEIRDIAVDASGRVCVLAGQEILVLDESGALKKSVSLERYRSEGGGGSDELFMDSEGRVYYCVRDTNLTWKYFELVEKDGLQLEDAGDIFGSYTKRAAASNGGVLLFSPGQSGSLYRYDRGSKTIQELLSWSDSGMLGSYVNSIVEIMPEIILVCYTDGMQENLYQLTRTSTEELPERETLVLASVGSSSEMQNAVTEFNKVSDTYRIVLADYEAEFGRDLAVSPALDAALLSSNPPDLIDLGFLDISKYAEQGVLEDLAPYLESSSIVSRENYLDNALEGMTIDGRLVCIPTEFIVRAVFGRSSQVGDLEGWSMEDVYKLTEAHPESMGRLIDQGYGELEERDYFLKSFCAPYYLEEFVDWDSLECNFDCAEFRRLLRWIGDYAVSPENNVEGNVIKGDGYVILIRSYIPNTALLVSDGTIGFESMVQMNAQFQEEVTLLGYPTADGEGTFQARVETAPAIYANSPHKEAAWEFIEYYLSRQRYSIFQGITTRKDFNQKTYDRLTNPAGEEDRIVAGNSITILSRVVQVENDEYPYDVIPKEQADMILHAVETADFSPAPAIESMIIEIVAQEAESYYNGDKSLEEVTGLIQNRVRLLLQEQRK